MSFDATQAVTDKIVHLQDEVTSLKAQRDAATVEFDGQIDAKEDELAGWQKLLGSDKGKQPAKSKEPSDPKEGANPEPAPEGTTTSDSEAGKALKTNGSKPTKKASAK